MPIDPSYCEHCPRRSAPYPGLPGTCSFGGLATSKFLVVGKAPGSNEIGTEPFTGPSGALLWGVGKGVGLLRHESRVLNVSRCTPCAKKGGLTPAQIGACWDDFNTAMQASQAEVVICLGGDALRRVTGLSDLDDY